MMPAVWVPWLLLAGRRRCRRCRGASGRQVRVRLVHAAVHVGDDHAVAVDADAGEPGLVTGEREVAAVHVADVDLAAHLAAGRRRWDGRIE